MGLENGNMPCPKRRLYTFIDSAYLHGRPVTQLAHALADGGSDLVQLRAKDWSKDRIFDAAEKIAPILRDRNVAFVINDYPDIALAVHAPLVHLGQEDYFDTPCPEDHYPELGAPHLTFGLSTHSPEQAQRSLAVEPNYIAIGPVYPTDTKPTAKAVTLDYVRWASQHVSLDWFAIGGIHSGNLQEVLQAGASGICVVSAILNHRETTDACRSFRDALDSWAT